MVYNAAGVHLGSYRINRANVSLIVRVEVADRFAAVLSVCEQDNQLPEEAFLLADQRNWRASG